MFSDAVNNKGERFRVGDKEVYAKPLSITQIYEISAIGSQMIGFEANAEDGTNIIALLFERPDNIIPIGKICNVALYSDAEEREANEKYTLENMTAIQAESIFMWAMQWLNAGFFLTATIATTTAKLTAPTKDGI